MSTMRHEGDPGPIHETELTVSLDKARREVADTIESLISKALEKAEQLSLDSITEIAPSILARQEIPDAALKQLSIRGKDLYQAILKLRADKAILAESIREGATNEELVQLVDRLAGWHDWWKTYVDVEIRDASTLTMVVGNAAYALQKKLTADGKSLLSSEAVEKLESNE